MISRKWGSPTTTLIGTRSNAKLKGFCSLYRTDPPLDAISLSWKGSRMYIFTSGHPESGHRSNYSVWALKHLLSRLELLKGTYWHLPVCNNLFLQRRFLHPDLERLNPTD